MPEASDYAPRSWPISMTSHLILQHAEDWITSADLLHNYVRSSSFHATLSRLQHIGCIERRVPKKSDRETVYGTHCEYRTTPKGRATLAASTTALNAVRKL